MRAGSRTGPPAEITAVAGNADTPISQNSTAHWPIASPHVSKDSRAKEISVGDEVDIHLGELWHRTIRLMGVNEAHGSSTNTAPIRAEPGLPRKEVIQPQLPLRLPCYDFTPIIDPTFDGCLPCGLAHRLRVLPTFVV